MSIFNIGVSEAKRLCVTLCPLWWAALVFSNQAHQEFANGRGQSCPGQLRQRQPGGAALRSERLHHADVDAPGCDFEREMRERMLEGSERRDLRGRDAP